MLIIWSFTTLQRLFPIALILEQFSGIFHIPKENFFLLLFSQAHTKRKKKCNYCDLLPWKRELLGTSKTCFLLLVKCDLKLIFLKYYRNLLELQVFPSRRSSACTEDSNRSAKNIVKLMVLVKSRSKLQQLNLGSYD